MLGTIEAVCESFLFHSFWWWHCVRPNLEQSVRWSVLASEPSKPFERLGFSTVSGGVRVASFTSKLHAVQNWGMPCVPIIYQNYISPNTPPRYLLSVVCSCSQKKPVTLNQCWVVAATRSAASRTKSPNCSQIHLTRHFSHAQCAGLMMCITPHWLKCLHARVTPSSCHP